LSGDLIIYGRLSIIGIRSGRKNYIKQLGVDGLIKLLEEK